MSPSSGPPLEELSVLKTPTPGPIRCMISINSMSSAMYVDSLDEYTMGGSELKAVQEVDESIQNRRTIF